MKIIKNRECKATKFVEIREKMGRWCWQDIVNNLGDLVVFTFIIVKNPQSCDDMFKLKTDISLSFETPKKVHVKCERDFSASRRWTVFPVCFDVLQYYDLRVKACGVCVCVVWNPFSWHL